MNFCTFKLKWPIACEPYLNRQRNTSFIIMNVNNRGGCLTCILLLEASVSESFFFRSNVFTFFLYFVRCPNISALLITLIGGVRQSSHISLRLSETSEHLRAVHYAFRRCPNISARFIRLSGDLRQSSRSSSGFPEIVCLSRQPILLTP